jgi:AraC-like DNA-binding protein
MSLDQQPYIRAAALSNVLRYIARDASDLKSKLSNYGLTTKDIADPTAIMSMVDFTEILHGVSTKADLSHLGARLGYEANLEDWGGYGFALLNAPTLGEFLSVICDFLPTWQNRTHMKMIKTNAHLGLEYQVLDPSVQHRPQDAEFTFSTIQNHIHRASRLGVLPAELTFKHPPLAEPAVYRRYFGILPVFNSSKNSIWYQSAAMANPTTSFDNRLYSIMLDYLERQKNEVPRTHTISDLVQERVHVTIAETPPNLNEISRYLGIHKRTLQRRLSESGDSFNQIIQRVRIAKVKRLANTDGINTKQLAFALGFSSPSAFTKWFGKSFGVSLKDFSTDDEASLIGS